jgi:hypothetical protein
MRLQTFWSKEPSFLIQSIQRVQNDNIDLVESCNAVEKVEEKNYTCSGSQTPGFVTDCSRSVPHSSITFTFSAQTTLQIPCRVSEL